MRTKLLAVGGIVAIALGTVLLVLALPAAPGVSAWVGVAGVAGGAGVAALVLAKLVRDRERAIAARRARGTRRSSPPGGSARPAPGSTRAAAAPGATGAATVTGSTGAAEAAPTDPPPAAPARPSVVDRVVELDGTLPALLRGALPYAEQVTELPDDAPVPSLHVRAVPAGDSEAASTGADGDGATVTIEHRIGQERLGAATLTVDRLPVDRRARVRRRVVPAPTSTLGLADAPTDPDALISAARDHRLVTVSAAVDDPVAIAGQVLHLAASGVPVQAAASVADRLPLLAPQLRAALPFTAGRDPGDDLHLFAHAATQRRLAWAHHDLRVAWEPDDGAASSSRGDPGRWEPRLRPVPLPSVSVVLVTRRPHLVPAALTMVAAQTGVDLEVVVALHGDDGDEAHAPAVRAELDHLVLEGRVLVAPSAVPFGAVLNAAVAASHGRTVAKWDDDDLYGPTHLLDLLVAARQTGAGLVGKAAEFVWLEETGETLWRRAKGAEAEELWLAGGTLLTERALLDEVGGYPEVSRAVDHHLKVRVAASGHAVFRTHAFGFVLRRHLGGHTWETPAERLREKAVRSFVGVPEPIGLGDAARFVDEPVVPR